MTPAKLVDRLTRTVAHDFGSGPRTVAQPLTFTPFASARVCSARCVFCSETLVHGEATVLGASLRPGPRYPAQLRRALAALEGLPVGVSLSGLEATDDAAWLGDVLDALSEHERKSTVDDKVLYTNAAGLVDDALVRRLVTFGLTRAEISRHAVEQSANDAIMRFRDDVGIRDRTVFENAVRATAQTLPVRLVCVVQKGGVYDLESARRYLAWASSLGITDVVFRELSRTGDQYRATRSLRVVDDRRVAVAALLPLTAADGFVPVERTRGYYYENERWRSGDLLVTFEHSDYVDMKTRHRSGVVYKLVFFANGNLCADWDPEREILLRT